MKLWIDDLRPASGDTVLDFDFFEKYGQNL